MSRVEGLLHRGAVECSVNNGIRLVKLLQQLFIIKRTASCGKDHKVPQFPTASKYNWRGEMCKATLLTKQRWNSEEGRVHVVGADSDVCMVMPSTSDHR